MGQGLPSHARLRYLGRLPIESESCHCSRRSTVRPKSGRVTASLHPPKSPQHVRLTPSMKNAGLASQLNSGMSRNECRRCSECAESKHPIDARPCPRPQSPALVGRLLPGSPNPRHRFPQRQQDSRTWSTDFKIFSCQGFTRG